MAWWRYTLRRAISAGMKVYKEACWILGVGAVVTPQFKGVCTIVSDYVFAYRFEPACMITSVDEIVTPSKFTCSVTSDYTLAVA